MPVVESVTPSTPLSSLNQGSFLRWAFTAAAYLAERQEELDALNVFPVPDGDTGTNMLRTLSSALEMLLADANGQERSLQSRLDELSRDALLSARGNSGVILSQLIVGLAEGIGLTRIESASQTPDDGDDATVGPVELATALSVAARRAREGVSNPVDGTILTVAEAAAAAAQATADGGGSLAEVVRATTEAALRGLAGTTSQLPQLAEAGVVDAGGAGLVVIYQALDDVVHRVDRRSAPIGLPEGGHGRAAQPSARVAASALGSALGSVPEYEVVYHLSDAESEKVEELSKRLAELGDSIVIGGSRDRAGVRSLVTVHVHTREPGPAIEAAHLVGAPAGIRVELLTDADDVACADAAPQHVPTHAVHHHEQAPSFELPLARPHSDDPGLDKGRLGILAGATGSGIAELMRETGAQVITPADGGAAEPRRLLASVEQAIRRTGCTTVLALPGRPEGAVAAQAAAVRANADGITVVVADTRSPVQALAALAVYDPDADPETEARRLATLAEAVRCGSVEVATRAATFAAGRCRRGDLLAYAEGDVRAVGPDVVGVAKTLVDHLLAPRASSHGRDVHDGHDAAAPELVTLVAGQGHIGLAESLAGLIERGHPGIEVVAIEGGQHDAVLLVGVE